MKVQQTSNVSFGMQPKIYGIRQACRAGIPIQDFFEPRDYIRGLHPKNSLATIVIQPKGRTIGSFNVEMTCDNVTISSKDDIVKRKLERNNTNSLPDVIRAVADEVCIRLKTQRATKAFIDAGIIKPEQAVYV